MGYREFEEGKTESKLGCLERAQNAFDNMTGMRNSRKLILLIVFIALFLDNMLLTTVVPIIPDFLWYVNFGDYNYTSECIQLAKNDTIAARHSHLFGNSTDQLARWVAEAARLGQQQHSARLGTGGGGRGVAEDRQVSTFYARLPVLHADRYFVDHVGLIKLNDSEIRDCFARADSWRHEQLVKMNIHVGVMFAAKSVMQLIVNPFVGPLTNRIGYSIPMFSGFVIMFVSTIIFAFGESYGVLFVARAIQGVGSACSSVSGMGMVAAVYPDDAERGRSLGIALSGLAFGVMVGPPFGGMMYQFVSKEAAFMMLAGLALLDGVLQLLVLKPGVRPEAQEGAPLKNLLRDPYILLAAGSITFGNMGIAMLEPSLPIWMKDTMRAGSWEQGVAFLPCSISYLIGTNLFGALAFRIGRWLSAGLGMVVMGISLIIIPFAKSLGHPCAELRSGLRNRHGRLVDDAADGLSGRPAPRLRLRQRLRHRRHRLLSRLRHRTGYEWQHRAADGIPLDDVEHRHYRILLRSAALFPEGPAGAHGGSRPGDGRPAADEVPDAQHRQGAAPGAAAPSAAQRQRPVPSAVGEMRPGASHGQHAISSVRRQVTAEPELCTLATTELVQLN